MEENSQRSTYQTFIIQDNHLSRLSKTRSSRYSMTSCYINALTGDSARTIVWIEDMCWTAIHGPTIMPRISSWRSHLLWKGRRRTLWRSSTKLHFPRKCSFWRLQMNRFSQTSNISQKINWWGISMKWILAEGLKPTARETSRIPVWRLSKTFLLKIMLRFTIWISDQNCRRVLSHLCSRLLPMRMIRLQSSVKR